MLLALDIGNTSIDLGLFAHGGLCTRAKLRTHEHSDPAVLRAAVQALLPPQGGAVCGAAVGSVVAARGALAVAALEPLVQGPCRCVDAHWDLGLSIDYDNPQAVGIDRLLAAAAARVCDGVPDAGPGNGHGTLVVIDAGTALTVDAVDAAGVFRGGLIMPGIRLALDALHRGTSLLPPVEPQAQPPLLGRNTQACMQSGAAHGTAAMVDGLVARIGAWLGPPTLALLTGGDGPLLQPLLAPSVRLEPDLVLRGLWLAASRHPELSPAAAAP